MVKCWLRGSNSPPIDYESIAFARLLNQQVGEIHTVKQRVAIQVIGLFRTDLQLGFFTLPFSSRFTIAYPLKPTTKWVSICYSQITNRLFFRSPEIIPSSNNIFFLSRRRNTSVSISPIWRPDYGFTFFWIKFITLMIKLGFSLICYII